MMNWRIRSWPSEWLIQAYAMIPPEGSVLDVGCFGWNQPRIAKHLGLTGLKHYGVDWGETEGVPEGAVFEKADLNREKLPFPEDSFDFVVVSHTIEHLQNPVEFFGDCIRVCKPGGVLYFEAPSERSLWLPGYPFHYDEFQSLSFFDDPTHFSRVWTPQAFHRLSRYYSCEPIKTGRLFSWIHRILCLATIPFCLLTGNKLLVTCVWQTIGWASFLIVRKPAHLSGQPPFRYYIPHQPSKITRRLPKRS